MPVSTTARILYLVASAQLLLGVARFATAADQSAAAEKDEVGWLYSKQIELYGYLFKERNLSPELREKLQQGFHRFAFEFWMEESGTNTTTAPTFERLKGYVKRILEKDARSAKCIDDPLEIRAFFRNGKLENPAFLPPVRRIDLATLTHDQYNTLVDRFRADFGQIAPKIPR